MTSLSGRNWRLSSLIELSAATLFFSVSGLQLYGQSLADSKAATYAATRIENRITIDGDLSERDWKEAPKIANLTQRQPNPGETPSEKTEITLLYDDNNLYIGVVAYDSEPDKVIGTVMERDGSLRADDNIAIVLDTFRTQQNAFYFATNPAGAFVDGLAFDNQELNTDWNAIWDMRTGRTDFGWVAEIAIPFKSLNFPSDSSDWGFNISRSVIRKLEESRWTGARLETDFLQISEAGRITNLQGLNQGIGLDVRPFVAASWIDSDTSNDDGFDAEPGVDIAYNITPSLKLTGTINTDFGETEVDERQINLGRFSVRFPEKRSFFLEDAGVFAFASTGPQSPGGIPSASADVFPFFSRRIGLVGGREVPLDAGIKLTGKVGQTELGVLNVLTGSTASVDSENLMVGRFKQNILEQSYIGGIFTNGNPTSGPSSSTYGVDARFATSDFLRNAQNFAVNAYTLQSNSSTDSDNGQSYGFSAHYPNDKYVGELVYRVIEDDFNPALGFVQRSNVKMYRAGVSYNPRPNNFLGMQQMFHDIFYTEFENLENGLVESREFHVTPLDWHFNSGDSVHAFGDYDRTYERLFAPFQISPGVILQPGEYSNNRYGFNFASARKRRATLSIRGSVGDFWSGTAEQVSTTFTYKLPPKFNFSLAANQTFAYLPEGDFITRIFTANIDYSVSPFLSFTNLIQYDNRSRNLGWQSRMRWTSQPGRDLFLVFNQGWLQDPLGGFRFQAQDTKIATKFQYTFRF
ncbi:MAG: DUF5916 domain-containing protein [Verrucomicrobiota bacterium]|nr:DUF5916 domain-containing protein [Verrucomicrobiota bacterium]